MGLTQHQPTPARRHFMMTSPRAQAAFHHQQFFFEQKDKLAHLLNTIGADARNATISLSSSHASTPTTPSDYHELLTVTTHLLSEAQTLSTWTFDMIESNGPQVEPFAEKVALVERVAGELRERALQLQQQMQQMQHLTNTTIPPPNPVGPRSCNPTLSTTSKKRSRACDDDDEDDDEDEDGAQQQQYQQQAHPLPPLSYKRSRIFRHPQQQQQQQQPQQELMSGIEPTTTSSCGTYAERFLQTPWWVQRPICD
ncbi:hypothetical protein D0869_13549 [Hortaea werneckii]|uniref:Uncharacterized protein n=1 Tax=Hortaea werneckii TaxID=91943 RepID=A0A3M6W4L8_HORWE|nr:hypothetical protein KC334_g13062 [Hortaea werneckii]KAI7017697.1 hypothetical protein KC355_g3588 [Hortaea werneckii]KAI7198138.1 hypothetical protein KC324_g3969 [Hortaea werneckii]KAI7579854.1 hypothetical protein KC316_g9267 [Hortaea werneckii]KAI7656085.1 hypothetical protein KC318_g12640 [Hortaea werneckii]